LTMFETNNPSKGWYEQISSLSLTWRNDGKFPKGKF
jgi:hypothetical protein